MQQAYCELHLAGLAHSIEAWQDNELVGGLYGVHLGRAFFGESMFSQTSGASKIAFATLACQLKYWQFKLIDCQIHTNYLANFGAKEVDRIQFEHQLQQAIKPHTPPIHWQNDWQMPDWGFYAD